MEELDKNSLIYEMSLHIGKLTLEVEKLRAEVAQLKGGEVAKVEKPDCPHHMNLSVAGRDVLRRIGANNNGGHSTINTSGENLFVKLPILNLISF